MTGEFYEILKNRGRTYDDRYKNCRILRDIESGETLLEYRENVEIPVTSNDKYHRVKSHEVSRLDMLAHKYYKNPLLWWVIAQANEIYDPFELLAPGTILRIPAIETLYGNNGILL